MYVCLALEHVATIPEEIEYVWKARWNFASILFLLFRYTSLGGITMLTYIIAGLSGPLSNYFCKHSIAVLSALAVFTMGIADALIVLRVSVLWRRQRVVLAILSVCFLLTFSTAVVCAVTGSITLVSGAIYVPLVRSCTPTSKPRVILGVWVPGMVFDVLVLSLTSWNACSRPRRKSTPLAQALHRDGIIYFMILAGFRTLNMFMILFAPFYLVGICVSWPVSAIVLSRCIMKLRKLERVDRDDDKSVEDCTASYSSLELETLDISRRDNNKSFTSYVRDHPILSSQPWSEPPG